MRKSGNWRQNHRNKHHTFPTSRFILKKNVLEHNAWHDLFGNKSTEEAKLQLEEWSDKFRKIKSEILNRHSWKLIFGNIQNLNEVKKIIDLQWRYPGIIGVRIPQETEQNKFCIDVVYKDNLIIINLKKGG